MSCLLEYVIKHHCYGMCYLKDSKLEVVNAPLSPPPQAPFDISGTNNDGKNNNNNNYNNYNNNIGLLV